MAERVMPKGATVVEEKLPPPQVTEEAALPKSAKAKKPNDDDDELDDLDEADNAEGPTYTREEIGPRIGEAMKTEDQHSVEELKEELDNDDMVPLLFPRAVHLQDKGLMHHFAQGVHMVPKALAKHWWLKHNGVRRAGPVVKAQPKQPAMADADE